MATTYNIVEKRYNGTDYDTLYPATKGENLVSAVPLELGGTGGTTGAAGMKNLIDALSTVTPVGTDLLPLKDVSGNIAGKATIDSILSLVGGGAKIQTGSYVGTGTYGQDNPCSLTFDFEPKILTITSAWTENGPNQYATAQYYQITIYIAAVQSALVGSNSATVWGLFNADTRDVITMTTAGQTVSWYSFTNDNEQLNNDQYTYYYIAIG